MSDYTHLAQLREGRIYALCGAHKGKRDWQGVWTAAKVECPKCFRILEEKAKKLDCGNAQGTAK